MRLSPLLSIVIPTKNRYTYLVKLVSYLSNINSNDLEIVIQDNTTNNNSFKSYLSNLNDNRIKYNHQPDWLSVTDNCEMALQQASGEYICMLGDDDGVTPDILDAVRWMKACEIDAILTSKPTYHWPGMISRIGGKTNSGRLFLYNYSGLIRKINIQSELHKVLRGGGTQLNFLPRVYHGIVAKRCTDELRGIANTCFPGPSPDMANAIGLTRTVKSLYYLDIPLIINGNCPSSAGGLGARAAHHGEIEATSFLPKNLTNEWPAKVPYFWSGPTILAASAVLSLHKTDRSQYVTQLNLQALYTRCLLFHIHYADRVFKIVNDCKLQNIILFHKYIETALYIFTLRVKSFLRNLYIIYYPFKKNATLAQDFSSIDSVAEYITKSPKYQKIIATINKAIPQNYRTS